MRAEIIAIGDELTTGQRLDTNSQWLAERLTECGVEVAFHTTIGDNLDDNVAAFRAALERTDVVVATGGLGPTADDLTRDALAAVVGVPLVRDANALEHVRGLFARRGRPMPERNEVQADFPQGAKPIPNEHGTAPGIHLHVQHSDGRRAQVFALPGVPAEMRPMWYAAVEPAIQAANDAQQVIRHHRIKCFGVGESDLESMLPDLIRRGRQPSVGITVSEATITLRITAAGEDVDACRVAMKPTIQTIHECLGTLVFGEEDDELQEAVVRLLVEQGKTLAIVEWASGGLITEWILSAHVVGACPLLAGVVVNTMDELQRVLAMNVEEVHGLNGAGSSDVIVATSAARAVRRLTGADLGLAVASFPEMVDAPDARIHVALATPERTRRMRFPCATHPAIRQARASKQALNALRLTLLGQPQGEG